MRVINTTLKTNTSRIKNLSLYLSASVISGVIGIVFNPFLAVNLSSLDYSIIGYFTSFNSLFTPILNFSLISYYVRRYFKIESDKRQLTIDTIISTLLLWGAISSGLIIVSFFVYCSLAKVELPFTPFALMSVAQLFFNNFLLLYQVNCRMKSEANRYFKITMSASLLTVLLSIILVIVFKFGAVGRMSAMLIASASIAFFVIKKTLSKFRLNIAILKEAVSFGWPVSASYIIQYFLIGIDIALLEPLNNISSMGLYVVAISITSHLSILYIAVSQTFEPDLYRAVAQYNYKKVYKIIILIVFILLPFILIYILFAKQVISLLTYDRYTEAYYFARVLSLGVLTTYLMVAIEGIVNAFGFTKVGLLNKIISSSLAVLLYYYLINNYQFMGAVWGRVFAPLIVFITSLFSLLFLRNKIKRMKYAEKN